MRLLGIIGPVFMLLAIMLARASGDESLHRSVTLMVIGVGVLHLVVYAIFAPGVYRDAWRAIQPDAVAEKLARFAERLDAFTKRHERRK